MRNELIAELNALVAEHGDVREMNRRLQSFCIEGSDFLAADAGETKPLPHHALLCDNAPADSPLNVSVDSIWQELSGSGWQYDGLYGPVGADSNIKLLDRDIDFSADRPAAPIGRQVALCMRIFSAPGVMRIMPALARAVQRHFNDIVIAHPVILHPALLVPVHRNGSHEYMSVMHALAGTLFGSLPRVSHYPRLAPELLLPHLTKVARHPCLALGLGKSWHVRFDPDKGAMRRKRETLVEHSLPLPTSKNHFLGSVMEMAELARPADRQGEGQPIPFVDAVNGMGIDAEHRRLVVATVAMSMFVASGVPPTAGSNISLSNDAPVDHDFLADVRKRREALLADPDFMGTIEQSMIRRLFSSRSDELSPVQVAEGADAIIHGLVAAGLKSNLTESAQFVLEMCIGRGRKDGNLPKAETASGIAFLQVIDAYGGFGAMGVDAGGDVQGAAVLPAKGTVLRALDAVKNYPTHPVPFRDQWTQALEVFWTEKSMTHVIETACARQARHAAEAAIPASNDETMSAVKPHARRRRAAV